MQEHCLVASENEARLLEMGGSFIAVDKARVNLDDLLYANRPGSIVRCDGSPNDCIQVFWTDGDAVGCVAGWHSEGV